MYICISPHVYTYRSSVEEIQARWSNPDKVFKVSTVSETITATAEKEDEKDATKRITSEKEVKVQLNESDIAQETTSIHQTIHIENHETHNRYAHDETSSSIDLNNISSSNNNNNNNNNNNKYEETNNSIDNEEEEEAASRDEKMEERDEGANDKVITTTTTTTTTTAAAAAAASTDKEYILEDKVQALPRSSSSNIESCKPTIMSSEHLSINPLTSTIKEPEVPSSVHKISPDFALALEEIQIPQPQKLSLTSELNTFDFPIAALENHIYSSSAALNLGLPVWNEESNDDDDNDDDGNDDGNDVSKNNNNNNNKGSALTYPEQQLPEELDIYYYSNDNPSDNPNEQSLSSKFRKGQKHKTKSPARASSVPHHQVCMYFSFFFFLLLLLLLLLNFI